MTASIAAAKAALRHEARARRDAIPLTARAVAADEIADRADVFLAALPSGAIICLYDAIGSEVSTRQIAARALARGLGVAYPRVVPGTLVLALHRATPAELAPGTLGIQEPAATAPTVRPPDIALVLLPGLAFDRRGARLGWGRGHYDATFAGASERTRLGLAFETQLVDRLPTDEHDLTCHRIVTEAAVHGGD